MQYSWMKLGFLALTLLGISTTANLLAACSNSTQTQAPTSSSAPMGSMEGMDHGNGMNHGGGMSHSMMDLGPADASYDLRFIDGMRLHHQGAIAMAQEAQQKSQRPEIRQLAQNIVIAQSREENELLRQWRQDWYPDAPSEPVMYGGEGNPTMVMSQEQQQAMKMSVDLGAADSEFDLRFMNAMIAHHQGALDMAKDALEKSQRPEVKKLAQDILDSQQAEINQMQQWRQAWYQQ
jgi:uncharacterized protein (DUF305 family)